MNCFVKFEFLIAWILGRGNWKQKVKTTNWPFSIFSFDFQNIEVWCSILHFLATNIENWDCKVLIFNFFPGGRVRPRTLSYLLSTHSILSFCAKTNTDICQWSKQFYLQYPFVMNMYFGAFRFFKWQGWSIDSNFFGSLPSGLSKIFKRVLRLGVSQSRCTRVYFERGLLPCPNRRKGFDGW